MEAPTFTLPTYPLPTQFSDPYNDWMYDPTPSEVLGTDPQELNGRTLSFIFNCWLPAGTFEEMAPYVPRVLELLVQQEQDEYHEELLETLIIWCHVEQAALARPEHGAFLTGLQEAFMLLFRRWTAEANPLNAASVEMLLQKGDYIAAGFHRPPQPWLLSEHFLPHLLEQLAQGSVPHAAWLLYAADEDKRFSDYPPLPLAPALRLAAMDMVEDWLLSTASREDIEFWDPIVTHTHAYFQHHPHCP